MEVLGGSGIDTLAMTRFIAMCGLQANRGIYPVYLFLSRPTVYITHHHCFLSHFLYSSLQFFTVRLKTVVVSLRMTLNINSSSSSSVNSERRSLTSKFSS